MPTFLHPAIRNSILQPHPMSDSYTIVHAEAPEPIYDLTVITVCFNAGETLRTTLQSVLAQKAKKTLRIEHIVVDGASTDDTPTWLAEQLAAGNIEAYVSEPDRGIYDAMNKGINMAHGRVLAFLNAADTYTEEDLRACIAPILEGRTQHTIATARLVAAESGDVVNKQHYNAQNILVITPGCHQAYFAAAAAYRAHGGYRARQFRCCADGMFINSLIAESGEPHVIPCDIVNYAIGGFSDACGISYAEEFIELQWHFHRQAMKRAETTPAYARALAKHLMHHYRHLSLKYDRAEDRLPSVVEHLHTMTDDILRLPIGRLARYLLQQMEHESELPQSKGDRNRWLTRALQKRMYELCEHYLTLKCPSYLAAGVALAWDKLKRAPRFFRRRVLRIGHR